MSDHDQLALRIGEVARGLEKCVETAIRLVSRAATRRVEEDDSRAMGNGVDAAAIDSFGKA